MSRGLNHSELLIFESVVENGQHAVILRVLGPYNQVFRTVGFARKKLAEQSACRLAFDYFRELDATGTTGTGTLPAAHIAPVIAPSKGVEADVPKDSATGTLVPVISLNRLFIICTASPFLCM